MKRLFIIALLVVGCSKDDGEDSCQCENMMALDFSEDAYRPVTLKICGALEESLENNGSIETRNGVRYISENDWSSWRQMAFEQGCMSAP